MTEEITIDVSNCPHKSDDDCMEVPICNEYGDCMGYQSCEAQTLCPYRSQKKIEHLERLKNKYYQQTLDDEITISDLITKCNDLEQENKELKEKNAALEDKLQLRMASDKESDAFWDEIFSEKDYPFNKENAYKELKDYYFVLEQLPKIYMEITGGTLSKTTYFASSVVEAYNDALDRYYDKIDDLEYDNNAYRSALEEINITVKQLLQGVSSNCINNTPYLTALSLIENKINEVLK